MLLNKEADRTLWHWRCNRQSSSFYELSTCSWTTQWTTQNNENITSVFKIFY